MSKNINLEAVSRPESLILLLKDMATEIAALRTLANELRTDHATFKSVVDSLAAAVQGDYLVTCPNLAIGSTVQNVANVAFSYIINGVLYYKAAVAAGTAPGNDVVPQGTFGAAAFDIDAAGTITVVEAADNATGYASAALAKAALAAVASDKVRLGGVTASKSDGAFTFGTTALNAANTTVAYFNGTGLFAAVSGAAPASLTAAAVTELVEPPK